MQVVTDLLECPVEQPHHRWDQRCIGQQAAAAQLQVSSNPGLLSVSASSAASNGSEVGSLAWSGAGGVSLLITLINILL